MEILFFLSLLTDKRRKSCQGNATGGQVTSESCFAHQNRLAGQKDRGATETPTTSRDSLFRLSLTQPGAMETFKNILSPIAAQVTKDVSQMRLFLPFPNKSHFSLTLAKLMAWIGLLVKTGTMEEATHIGDHRRHL